MPQIPKTINIQLRDLVALLGYYWSAVNSHVGDLGIKSYEETVKEIGSRSSIKITPEELETLVYHTKQAIFEKLKPVHVEKKVKNYNHIMRRLKEDMPHLFKQLPSGEIVFIDFEERGEIQ